MSKSVGNVVAPSELVKVFGADAFRYYMLRHIPSHDDGDFAMDKMLAAYNGELGNGLGNLVQRVAVMIEKYQDGVIGDTTKEEHDIGPYMDALAEYRFDKALEYCFNLIRGLNQYIDEEKPWQLAKGDSEHLKEVLAYSVSGLMQISDLLEPFMPATAAGIRNVFKEGLVDLPKTALFPRIDQLADTK
jgi:methionyl-tRNA synthetase